MDNSQSQDKRGDGRGELKQTTILIYKDQGAWMDEVCFRSKQGGGVAITKAALIRELIDFAKQHGLSLSELEEEAQIGERLKELVTRSQ